jgi:PPK2 family polyphosphate:nucleotide phosphotransferase
VGVKRWDGSEKFKMADLPTREDGGMTKEAAEARFLELADELEELQELMYAAADHSLLVVLQGRDTAGKDGTLKAVAGAMNPVGVRVASFKVPTATELAHDFLWRVHRETPVIGETVFFNRSHYEDVLVVRVHNLAPEKVWKARYDHINAFEKLLTDSDVIVVKFLLNISKDEQEKRLRDRELEPKKAWKLNAGDWTERQYWDHYTRAYDDAVERCARPNAPWYVIPADHKWYRDVAVAEALIAELRPYKDDWKAKLAEVGKTRREELDKVRPA